MSEFGDNDVANWMRIAFENNVSVEQAIYYAEYFSCQRDQSKFMRALDYMEAYTKRTWGFSFVKRPEVSFGT